MIWGGFRGGSPPIGLGPMAGKRTDGAAAIRPNGIAAMRFRVPF
jgi:hypothetical protein